MSLANPGRARLRARSQPWAVWALCLLAWVAASSPVASAGPQASSLGPRIPAKLERALTELRSVKRHQGLEAAQSGLRAALEGDVFASLLEECDFEVVEAGIQAMIRSADSLRAAELRRELREELIEQRRLRLPAQHRDVLSAKFDLGICLLQLQDFRAAREIFEELEAVLQGRLSERDPLMLDLRANLAVSLSELGDTTGALKLQERVHALRLETASEDDPRLVSSQENLAVCLFQYGDVQRALRLQRAVLTRLEARLPADHLEVLQGREILALMRTRAGDIEGALELMLPTFEALARILDAEDPALVRAKENVALIRTNLGQFDQALELQKEVLGIRQQTLPANHPHLLRVQQNVAGLQLILGDVEAALELQSAVCESLERDLGTDSTNLLRSRDILAMMWLSAGEVDRALEAFERSLRAWDSLSVPADHISRFGTLVGLAQGWAMKGEAEPATEYLRRALGSQLSRCASLRFDPPRAARSAAFRELQLLETLISVDIELGGVEGIACELLNALEALREVSTGITWSGRSGLGSPELAPLLEDRTRTKAALGDMILSIPRGGEELEDWRRELLHLSEHRDQIERDIVSRLGTRGSPLSESRCADIARRLGPDEAWVRFCRFTGYGGEPITTEGVKDRMIAFIVTSDGSVTRLELGPARVFEDLALRWRAAVGRPVEPVEPAGQVEGAARGGRPIAATHDLESERLVGEELRRLVLDSVLQVAREHTGRAVQRLHVVLEDSLHLIPLDALPAGDGGRIGDGLDLLVVVWGDELQLASEARADDALVILGGVDYEAELAGSGGSHTHLLATAASERAGELQFFGLLPSTEVEAATLASIGEARSQAEAILLTGSEATKSALFELAPRARYLHVATHGWFASQLVDAGVDGSSRAGALAARSAVEEQVSGLAPDTLCGLALAGANRGPDAFGRVPGIVTAEELAALDLSRCELAVLSACETNVGLRRSGQGIRSLQTALHAAGARTAVTSLWRVGDDSTRRLMEAFYSELWSNGAGKAEALWRAKQALRAEGYPLRDWAGWVLTGRAD